MSFTDKSKEAVEIMIGWLSHENELGKAPAKIAVASPKALWFDGFPRRISSLSIAGRSSCISENACIISTAAP